MGGPSSSFGIWHEQKDLVKELAAKYDVKIVRIHTHIGSGSDPDVWQSVAGMSLDLVREFPDVTTLNLGGGYKVSCKRLRPEGFLIYRITLLLFVRSLFNRCNV